MVGIYKITSPSGKVYIGQSWDIKDRWRNHGRDFRNKVKKTKLYSSMEKYGFDTHIFEVIHLLPADSVQKDLDYFELQYLRIYKSHGIELLNIKEGGCGGKHSPETKAKMSRAHVGKKKPIESHAKRSATIKANGGFKMAEDHKEKLRAINIGGRHSKEHKVKISAGLLGNTNAKGCKGKKISQEHKNAISIARTGMKLSQQWKDKIKAGHARRKLISQSNNILL